MTGYTLTCRREAPPHLADGAALRPDRLAGLDRETLGRTVLAVGRTTMALADLFEIEGSPGERLTLRNMPWRWDRLGAGMTGGELVIEGDAGDRLGAGMSGGRIRVRGNAGDHVGGPDGLATRGMTGGEILIDGDAGDGVGVRMRRGTIAVAGRCGASPGYRMLAGTIVLAAAPRDRPGLGMRRGTVFVTDPDPPIEPGPSFTEAGEVVASAAAVVLLVLRRLRELGWQALPEQALDPAGRWRLWQGDRFELNRGQLWQSRRRA